MLLPYHLGMPGRLDATERRLRPLYGTGHYSVRQWSEHHHYRRGQAMGPAWIAQRLAAVRAAAVPDGVPEFVADWQTALGIEDANGTVEERMALVLGVARMPRDHTIERIEAGLIALTGGDYWVLQDHYTGAGSNGSAMSYLVQVYNPVQRTSRDRRWRIAKWYLLRMTPAHTECVVKFPDEPWGPGLLGSEE